MSCDTQASNLEVPDKCWRKGKLLGRRTLKGNQLQILGTSWRRGGFPKRKIYDIDTYNLSVSHSYINIYRCKYIKL